MTPHDKLKNAIEKFENQFNVATQSTGNEMSADRNGGIREEEFWVDGVINSEIDGLEFKTGGWFSIDTRGEKSDQDTIYCSLAVKMNGENLNSSMSGTKALKSRYNPENEEWEELKYRDM